MTEEETTETPAPAPEKPDALKMSDKEFKAARAEWLKPPPHQTKLEKKDRGNALNDSPSEYLARKRSFGSGR